MRRAGYHAAGAASYPCFSLPRVIDELQYTYELKKLSFKLVVLVQYIANGCSEVDPYLLMYVNQQDIGVPTTYIYQMVRSMLLEPSLSGY